MRRYARLIRDAKASVEYWTQTAMREFVRDLIARMDARDMSRAELATKINASPAYVTKILRGNANFTLESMTKLAMAVGGKIRVEIDELDDSSPVYCEVRNLILREAVGSARALASNSVTVHLPEVARAANEQIYSIGNTPTLTRSLAVAA